MPPLAERYVNEYHPSNRWLWSKGDEQHEPNKSVIPNGIVTGGSTVNSMIEVRVLSVTIAVVLALVLSLSIGWLWRVLNQRFPRQVQGLQPTTRLESQASE